MSQSPIDPEGTRVDPDPVAIGIQQLLPLVDQLPIAVYVAGSDPREPRHFVNDRIGELLGIPAADPRPPEMLWQDLLHPEDRAEVLERIAESRIRGTELFLEYRMLAGDGATRWVSDHARPVLVRDSGELTRIGAIRDITERKRMHLALRHSLELNDAILRTLPDLVAFLDRDLTVQRVSDSCSAAHGLPRENIEGRPLHVLFDEDAAASIRPLLLRALGGERVREELWIELGARGRRCIDWHAAPHRYGDGAIDGVVCIGRDVTDAVHARRAVAEGERRFRNMARNIPGAIIRYLMDHEGNASVLYVSDACRDLWGLEPKTVQGDAATLWQMVHPEDAAALQASLQRSARDLSDWEQEWRICLPGCDEKWLQGRGKPRHFGNGSVVWDSVILDVTARKAAESALEHLALHDPLTGLPNRLALNRALEDALRRNRERRGTLALLFIDLDNFKQVNDSFTHSAGDRLLVELTAQLQAVLRDGVVFARISGDEFAVMLELPAGGHAHAEVASLAARLLDAAAGWRFDVDNQQIAVTMSIGISMAPDDAANVEAMLRTADIAMFKAKAEGRNRFQFYDPAFSAEAQRRIAFESDLRKALEEGDLQLHYQPRVDTASGAILAVEALLRWRHPERGMMQPLKHLQSGEGGTIIGAIGDWVLKAALANFRQWQDAGIAPPRLVINLSSRHLGDRDFPARLQEMLRAFELPARCIELDLTEDLLMHEGGNRQRVIEHLAEMGCSLAIDDFGTGRASLAYLQRLPLHCVKIDHSFIHALPADGACTMLRGMLALVRSLGLDAVAEGVETKEQADFLAAEGCRAVQGFLYAAPAPADILAQQLSAGRIVPRADA